MSSPHSQLRINGQRKRAAASRPPVRRMQDKQIDPIATERSVRRLAARRPNDAFARGAALGSGRREDMRRCDLLRAPIEVSVEAERQIRRVVQGPERRLFAAGTYNRKMCRMLDGSSVGPHSQNPPRRALGGHHNAPARGDAMPRVGQPVVFPSLADALFREHVRHLPDLGGLPVFAGT